ncbi:GNVR domain-containing protein [Maritimibacter sp. HL-12]|uniref:GumC family protein n=1 Tax=Maritimibacter sp. HL-12 TaxID=1162418 RepID=UPI000A0F18DC|nr:GNVR domain-containing protein [Maritimibacter sp. HL-12]SMH42062.1 Uncharacterized protein involved in exopolysaccharide biosynthesis [Maritimibacter sp. HL-12]
MANHPEVPDDEVDLGELVAGLWAYRAVTALVTTVAVVGGGWYALNAEKVYQADAVFQLEDSKSSGLSLPSEMGGLAALAGLGGITDEGNILFDRIHGREFIEEIDTAAALREDEFFNSYDPDAQDPLWKAVIKWAIGYRSDELDPDQVAEKNVVDNFRKNVLVEETENGALTISVEHTDPTRAADIANIVMDRIVTLREFETETRQTRELSYLSETLADTLREMESTQARLKNFAIENSTLSLEALGAGSVALDEIRNRLDRAIGLQEAADALLDVLNRGETGPDAYARLRQSHPIIDDVEFRRVLGLSEIISEFSWPDKDLLDAVATTLKDRRERIEREKERLEGEAISYANAAEQLATLEREANIAEASYTVLIEQVKAQSLLAGYEGETAKVFERAVPPLAPSKPNRMLVLAGSLALGLFVGSGFALAFATRKGVFFSKRSLVEELNPLASVSARGMRRHNGRSLQAVRAQLEAKGNPVLSEIAIALRNSTSDCAVVLGGGAKCRAKSAAFAVGTVVAKGGRKVAIVDLSSTAAASQSAEAGESFWTEVQSEGAVRECAFTKGERNIDLLSSRDYDAAMKELVESADIVIFSAETPVAEVAATALSGTNPTTVLLARPKRTSKSLIHRLGSLKLPTVMMLE